ncbi:cyclopropane-fatty-acyl-phospholipid synthase family protein [Nocardia sp. CDC153]|uniref:cyclopropane-fatty-acyl-phospholipid synthase family protein n=1 Tax=Nocardia sp. CDC153 TaxID=3112167 RepID=UPI002DB6C9DA|nr:cyclopropane-fatty-acyl-phospholipid synthase family protein [Nocardia sp. CDC153]MEC3953753.1 cyclopropane-fatty-acyl-phospholipid synthase family protein [Nocardia sp. CDC153]
MTVPVCTAQPSSGPRTDRWAYLRPVPRGARVAVGRPVAMALFGNAVARLPVRVELPGGRSLGGGRDDPAAPSMVVHDPAAFAARIAATGLIGFGEAYMAGDWSAPDPAGVLTVFACAVDRLVPAPLQSLRPWLLPRQPREHRATDVGARNNAAHHYDLSNEFFASFLDDTMTYSSALFEWLEPGPVWGDLADAQRRKIDRLLDDAGVGPGRTLLEIGTGWGELAIRAARRGARVRSVTLSSQQQTLARQRAAAAGVADRVSVELLDYRAVRGRYDAVVSVEMMEAVGFDYLPDYFQTLTRVLAPGGRAAVQVITMPHARMLATRHTHTWIQKYIFPGGFLPSETLLAQQLSQHSGLRAVRRRALGPHYAQTLRLWRERFDAAAQRVGELGFDDVFRRMWQLYLAYSEAGFRSGYLDVVQLVLEHRPTGSPSRSGPTP